MSKSTNDNNPQKSNPQETKTPDTGNQEVTSIGTQITFENAIVGLGGLIKELNIPCGISEILQPPLAEAVNAASVANPEPQTIREPLERFIQSVDEYQETINAVENPFIGFDTPASFLRYSGATLTGCLPQALRVPIPANAVMLALTAAQKKCLNDCLDKLAKCTGLAAAAVLLCGLGCLPSLFFGPAGYGGCVALCAGIAGGGLEAVCLKNFIDCVRKCI